ncbi:extra-large guanine nucleotide-binding protein 1 [Phalaenopsis equestris]|uniref:extra-large guanine nucleotide-binding protein 1 n=1 Tax=Phalaenopsis equestris TaxID=78828 RepID=UPI0009E2C4BE|nr:extra-large guanine nucleotide-binding protein 1 [Phalaenopsis equestris]XP_020584149.1 extra-large guanine nucleotide-binding protein 1 [Phalaenopsis equestris]XP_020584150.1 extra-large guanine nucleotide-binding protein 1 [Phalaenopsis equestris]XP_020584152.1 extra-large guanine nucleotide-binding protein 1 [Phalaenopsis equestris]
MDRSLQSKHLSTGGGDAVDYALAVEYSGPPIPYEIPQAIPIEIERIPIAAVVSPALLSDHLSLPVAQPLPSPNPFKKTDVSSPTSVIENHIAVDGELSGEVASSGAVVFSSELKRSDGSLNERNSMESDLSSDFGLQSSVSEEEYEDERDSDINHQVRPVGVSFQGSAETSAAVSSDMITAYQGRDEEYVRMVKKGACFRCLKGNRFTEKEVCLVCDAKYCSGCVLKAMGSMPEGRKCVPCIGGSVDESKRERLGNASRMLKRLLSNLEVEQVMKAEKYCEANQLRPEDVCVNGKPLTHEEIFMLQSCPCSPSKLRPGYYWYDKVSGFWGKVGHKPDKIISPNLNVGGSIMRNASNGNTGILINGREITKVELQMLKWAGVQCAGNPHFWVNSDGTYQEEGQKNIKGQIWGKARTKLLCSFLSLPVPSKAAKSFGEEVNISINRAVHDYIEQRTTQKLLLVGSCGSGSSTLFKQANFLYKRVPFNEDELQSMKLMIQTKIYSYLGILLEGREHFEEEYLSEKRKKQFYESSSIDEQVTVTPYSISTRLKELSDWLLKVIAAGNLEAIFPAATREYAPLVEELWNTSAIQLTYKRISELQSLPAVACYFLDRVVEISRVDYEPSKLEILYAEGMASTNGLACMEFFYPQSDSGGSEFTEQDAPLRFQLMRLHSKGLGTNLKWLDMFEDVQLVIFCIALSDYGEVYETEGGEITNKMMEDKKLFESFLSHPTFHEMDFLLVLNKFDLLEQMIENTLLTTCDWFDDFDPVISRYPNKRSRNANNCATLAQTAFHYVAVKFKRLFYSLTRRKLYVTLSNGLDSDSVDAAIRYAREILKWKEEIPAPNEDTCTTDMYSSDPSSYSH